MNPTTTEYPKINKLQPLFLFRYFMRFFASFIPPGGLKSFLYSLTGIVIGPEAFIGEGVYFVDGFKTGLVEIETKAVLSPKVTVVAMACPYHSKIGKQFNCTKTGKVTIGESAWIGAGAVILPGVCVGDGAILGANTVAATDIPDGEVWAGNPAAFVKKVEDYGRRPEEIQ